MAAKSSGVAVMTSTRKTLAARGFSEAQMGDLRRMIGPPLWKSFHDAARSLWQ